jgi:hypothetical protein
LASLGINADDAEEIMEALHREGTEEAFDKRSSWHIRTLMAQCVEVIDQLKASVSSGMEEDVVEALNIMASLAENSPDLQSGFMRAGAHIEVIEAAKAQLKNPSEHIAEAVLGCICSFCRYGESKPDEAIANVLSFGDAGVASILVATLKQHFTNAVLVELVCEAVFNLSVESENRSRLGQAGACEVLAKLLIHYCTDPATCQPICRAIGCMSFQQDDNRARFNTIESRIMNSTGK